MFLRIIFLVLIVCQDLVLKWSLCQLLFSVVRERVGHALRPIFMLWPGLLEAWLVLTSVKYHENLYILIPLNQRLALTRLRATGPWSAKFDRWVYAENLYSILKLVYCDSWSWQSFVSTWDVFNCLFLLDVRNEIRLLLRVFCYSWLVCLLGFGWEIRRLSKSEIRFRIASTRFRFSPCLIEKSEAM